ncbi:MAG: aromatic acid exporter family protein [Actinomycetota bacterium]|nr:aromatic acid exporter family protein [Actinomycetota bacterium]
MRRLISRMGRRAVSGARDDGTDARRLMHDTVSRKGPERQLVVQVLKSVVAAMLAWLIAIHGLEVRQPFVAPMIALLMVQPTIVQSLVKGSQQVAAVTVGMLTALVVFGLVDNTVVALGIALLITTGFAAWPRLGDQGTYAPIVALTMISLQSVGETYFERRLLETVVGVVVGAAINFAVKPPHYLDSARASATICVDDATGIMRDIAEGLRSGWSVDDARGWVARTDRLQSQVSSCLEDLGWAGESVRLNFRRNRVDTATPTATYRPVIDAVGSVAEPLEHFARTLAIRARDDQDGSREDMTFLADCATLLDDIAEDVADWANAETPIHAPSRTEANENDLATQGSRQLSELADRVRALPPAQVTYSGAMLIAIEQILEALHDRVQPQA